MNLSEPRSVDQATQPRLQKRLLQILLFLITIVQVRLIPSQLTRAQKLQTHLSTSTSSTYRGDITVTLSKGSKTLQVYKGSGSQANVIVSAKALAELKGEEVTGEYTLHVVDSARVDTGKLIS